jgi:hypothetical protein
MGSQDSGAVRLMCRAVPHGRVSSSLEVSQEPQLRGQYELDDQDYGSSVLLL